MDVIFAYTLMATGFFLSVDFVCVWDMSCNVCHVVSVGLETRLAPSVMAA